MLVSAHCHPRGVRMRLILNAPMLFRGTFWFHAYLVWFLYVDNSIDVGAEGTAVSSIADQASTGRETG